MPAELVARAAAAGVAVLALTDHDTTAGIGAARDAAVACGLVLVSGVEVSVTWRKQTIHVLGLQVDPEDSRLREGLQRMQRFRSWRAEEIGRRLEKSGIPETRAAAGLLAGGGCVGRTHFARVLMERGHGKSLQQVFKRFLVSGKPGYVPGCWAALEEAVGWIRGAGGLAVIAHPARYRLKAATLRELLGEFRECSGVGLEVVSGSHSRDDVHHMARLADKFQLLASQGSDYHGPEKPWVQLGKMNGLPPGCRPVWESQSWRQAADVAAGFPDPARAATEPAA